MSDALIKVYDDEDEFANGPLEMKIKPSVLVIIN